jgi:site-specific DNA recombinase
METRRREASVGIYTRISSDPEDQKLGVQRQEADCRKLCQDRGWTVVDVFCDNDHSAFNRRKPRPRYQTLLDAVRAGKIDTIVCWHPDRLHRQTRELNPFIDLVNEYGVQIATVTAGTYDLSTPTGRMNARIVGATGEYESEHKAERIKRKLEQNAIDGKHHGGGRPYGWRCDDHVKGHRHCLLKIVPEEAEVVRKSIAMLISGESLRAISRALNAEGHTTATGKPWTANHVRDMINRPINAGLRARGRARRRKDGSRDEIPFEILGPGAELGPLVSEVDFYQAHAILSNPARRTRPGHPKIHLLSGIAGCGLCKTGKMIVSGGTTSTRKGDRVYQYEPKPVYRCRDCGKISRNQAHVDGLVTQKILEVMSSPSARLLGMWLRDRDQTEKAQTAAKRIKELQARLDDAAQAYAAEMITIAQLTTINSALMPELSMAQAEAGEPNQDSVLGDLSWKLIRARDDTLGDATKAWQETSPSDRRKIVRHLLDVEILPTRRGRGFDPESVKITVRHPASAPTLAWGLRLPALTT